MRHPIGGLFQSVMPSIAQRPGVSERLSLPSRAPLVRASRGCRVTVSYEAASLRSRAPPMRASGEREEPFLVRSTLKNPHGRPRWVALVSFCSHGGRTRVKRDVPVPTREGTGNSSWGMPSFCSHVGLIRRSREGNGTFLVGNALISLWLQPRMGSFRKE
jgi:hypothetical protein